MSVQSRLDGMHVLVGDDTRSVLDVVTDMLKHNGAEVTAVGTAEVASVIRAGFQYHVAKPVGLNELIGVVAILALKEHPSGRLVD